jgi:hypothetical protein
LDNYSLNALNDVPSTVSIPMLAMFGTDFSFIKDKSGYLCALVKNALDTHGTHGRNDFTEIQGHSRGIGKIEAESFMTSGPYSKKRYL